MKFGKTAKIAMAAVTAAAVLGGGIFYFANRAPSKEVTVVPVSNVYTSYWGDNKTLDGFVTTGSLQEIPMNEGGFDKVNVKEGDTVHKGDTLVEFDSTQSDLILRGDQARINLIKSQIAAFEKQISDNRSKISTLKKALAGAKPTTPPADGSTTTPPVTTPTAYTVVDDVSMQALNKHESGAGTQEKPYRIPCTKDAVVKNEFWTDTTNKYVIFDIYTDSICSETTWLTRWTVDGSQVPVTFHEDWVMGNGLILDTAGTYITGFDTTKLFPYGSLTLTMPEDVIEKIPVGDELNPETMTPEEIKAQIQALNSDIDHCEKQINDSTRELRQAQITYEKDKMTLSAGKIISSIDGTVVSVGDASTPVGDIFLRVQGTSSYAVSLYVNELMLGELAIGTTVQLTCYESGTMAPAVITEMDPEPVTGYYSGGNANASTYQVTAEITDPDAQPRLGEWCQATLNGQPADQPSDTIYLPLFLVREDAGGAYVMRADENKRLQKQYVITGKSLWGSYVEVKNHVTLEDHLAFPYGTAVKEGAPTVEASYFDGY